MVRAADLRITPTGTAVLRIAVECDAEDGGLTLMAVMSGEGARETASLLKPGCEVRVVGRLRHAIRKNEIGRPGIEVTADSVELLDQKARPAS